VKWPAIFAALAGCAFQPPVVVTPPTCYCIAEPVTCEEKNAGNAAARIKREERVEQLREETGKARQQVETMKGIAGKASNTPTTTPSPDASPH
jgi:hypothetical protein